MTQALLAVAFVVAALAGTAVLVAVTHRVLRPPSSSTEGGRGMLVGRLRLHTRTFEQALLLAVASCTTGTLYTVADASGRSALLVGAFAMPGIAVWWAWRRGALRRIAPAEAGADVDAQGVTGDEHV